LYARPFTNNRPVGFLTEDIIPAKDKELFRTIIAMRHQLFAHGDASVMTRPDDYPNELVFENDNQGRSFHMTRSLAEPWDVGYFLNYLAPRLPDGRHALLKALLAAINAPEQAVDLDRFPAWRDATPIARDAPWPELAAEPPR
jgi:hypothetical protein